MKFLNHFWPWNELNRLNEEVEFLKRTLEHEQTSHNLTRASLQDHKLELIDHRARNTQSQKDIRKLATILAMRGGITLILLFLSLSASGQPILRQLFTTNPPPILSSISGPMVTTNGSGVPELTYNGGGLTNITGVAVAQGTNIITRTNGQVVTVNGVTDTNVINILLAGATNQSTVVSNGVVAHTVTVAGTADQITSSVGTAQTIAANPATILSLPDPLIAPGKVSANIISNRAFAAIGVVTNDANGKLYTTPILDPALVNFTPATNQSTVVSNGLAPRMVFSLQSYMILASTVSANQTNFFAIHGTTSKSTAETSAKEIYLTGGAAAGHGGWVSNFWVYFNSSIGSSTNLFFYLITNGVATGMGMNYTGNGSGNRVAADNTHPFFIATSSDWSIGMTNNNNLPSSLVFSWGIDVYPQ